MISRYPGECAACGGRYQRGDDIKVRFERHYNTEAEKAEWVRVPGRYSHAKCPPKPKVRVPEGIDPETGEILMVTPRDDQLTLPVVEQSTVDVTTTRV